MSATFWTRSIFPVTHIDPKTGIAQSVCFEQTKNVVGRDGRTKVWTMMITTDAIGRVIGPSGDTLCEVHPPEAGGVHNSWWLLKIGSEFALDCQEPVFRGQCSLDDIHHYANELMTNITGEADEVFTLWKHKPKRGDADDLDAYVFSEMLDWTHDLAPWFQSDDDGSDDDE